MQSILETDTTSTTEKGTTTNTIWRTNGFLIASICVAVVIAAVGIIAALRIAKRNASATIAVQKLRKVDAAVGLGTTQTEYLRVLADAIPDVKAALNDATNTPGDKDLGGKLLLAWANYELAATSWEVRSAYSVRVDEVITDGGLLSNIRDTRKFDEYKEIYTDKQAALDLVTELGEHNILLIQQEADRKDAAELEAQNRKKMQLLIQHYDTMAAYKKSQFELDRVEKRGSIEGLDTSTPGRYIDALKERHRREMEDIDLDIALEKDKQAAVTAAERAAPKRATVVSPDRLATYQEAEREMQQARKDARDNLEEAAKLLWL